MGKRKRLIIIGLIVSIVTAVCVSLTVRLHNTKNNTKTTDYGINNVADVMAYNKDEASSFITPKNDINSDRLDNRIKVEDLFNNNLDRWKGLRRTTASSRANIGTPVTPGSTCPYCGKRLYYDDIVETAYADLYLSDNFINPNQSRPFESWVECDFTQTGHYFTVYAPSIDGYQVTRGNKQNLEL